MRVTAATTRATSPRAIRRGSSATSAKVGRRFRKVRSGRVKIPFGRRATLRGRLTLSAGQSLRRPNDRRDVGGPQEAAPVAKAAGTADHRPPRPLLAQGSRRPEPHVPPRVRWLRRRARHRSRRLRARAGVEHDPRLAHAPRRRPRPLLRPPAQPRPAHPRPRPRAGPPGPRARASGARSRTPARTARAAGTSATASAAARAPTRSASASASSRAIPFELGYSRSAEDPGGLRGRTLREPRPIAPDGTRAPIARAARSEPRARPCDGPRRELRRLVLQPPGRDQPARGGLDRAEVRGNRHRRSTAASSPSVARTTRIGGGFSQATPLEATTPAGRSPRPPTRRSADYTLWRSVRCRRPRPTAFQDYILSHGLPRPLDVAVPDASSAASTRRARRCGDDEAPFGAANRFQRSNLQIRRIHAHGLRRHRTAPPAATPRL